MRRILYVKYENADHNKVMIKKIQNHPMCHQTDLQIYSEDEEVYHVM